MKKKKKKYIYINKKRCMKKEKKEKKKTRNTIKAPINRSFLFPSCQVIAPLIDHQNRLYLYLFFSQRSAIPTIFFL